MTEKMETTGGTEAQQRRDRNNKTANGVHAPVGRGSREMSVRKLPLLGQCWGRKKFASRGHGEGKR